MATHALSYGPTDSVFRPHEILLSLVFSAATLVGFFALLVFAGKSRLEIDAREPPPPKAMPIAVKPVLDDLPLLKKGGKKLKPKLPEMWKKQPPVQRYEAAKAPSTKAAKTPQPASSVPLVKPDAEAPPPDAEVAKTVDQVLLDKPDAEATSEEEEGAADGVKEGTETDPLKARAVSQYLGKIAAWFNARFRPPAASEELPCDVLKKLGSSVSVSVGPDRRITGYSVTRPSGNAAFDERVKSTMDRVIGEELPPPPPLYPDIVGTSVFPRFSGGSAQCD
jgi:hypothetical protein